MNQSPPSDNGPTFRHGSSAKPAALAGQPAIPIVPDTAALTEVLNRARHLVTEMDRAFDELPPGVDAHLSLLRSAVKGASADAKLGK